jgi:hypothetical protein
MYFALCGPPSPATAFATQVAMHLLRLSGEECELVVANAATEMVRALKERAQKSCLLVFDSPDWRVLRAILDGQVPTVHVSDTFEEVVSFVMAARGLTLEQAVRLATQSAACLYEVAAAPATLDMRIGDGIRSLDGLAEELASAWGLSVDDRVLEELHALYLDARRSDLQELLRANVEHAAAASAGLAGVSGPDRELVIALAEQYRPMVDGKPVDVLEWPVRVLVNGAKPGTAVDLEPVEMLGPARILVYGPYLHLCTGEWELEVTCHVSQNHSGNSMLFEVVAGDTVVAMARGELPAEGGFLLSQRFSVVDAHTPIEIRFAMLTGAIEGVFQPASLILRRFPRGAGTDGGTL